LIKKRIISAISGNVLMQVVNLVIQVAGIPLLLKYWGVNYYGEWLVLFTIPSFIAISDMGLGSSTTSELSMLLQSNREEEAGNILRNTFWFILLVGGIPFFLLALSVFVLPWYDWLNFSTVTTLEFKPAFVFLILYIYLSLFLTIPLGYYRVKQIYHRERYISSIFRAVEFLLVILAVIAGYKIVIVALIYFLVRLLQLVFIVFDLSIRFKSFKLFPFEINFSKFKHLLKPGLSAMTIYMGQNILSQGLISIIGIGLGSAQVVLFSTTRTLVNMVKQVVGIINLSVTSEFSYAFGAGNMDLLRKLFRYTVQINALICTILLSGLYFFGNWIFHIWTRGEVSIVEPFFTFFLISTLFGAMWNAHLVLLVSTNRLGRTGLIFLLLAFVLIAVNAICIKAIGISGVSLSLLCFEVAMLWAMSIGSKAVLSIEAPDPVLNV